VLQGAVDAVEDVLRVEVIVGARVASVSVRLLRARMNDLGQPKTHSKPEEGRRKAWTHKLEAAERV